MARQSQSRETKFFIDFTGGLVENCPPDNMQDNQLAQADNIDLLPNGGFQWRPGLKNINGASFNGNITQIIEFPLTDGSIKTLIVMDKKLYEVLTNGTLKFKLSVNSNRLAHVVLGNKLYFIDGVKYMVYGEYDYTTTSNDGQVTVNAGQVVYNAPVSKHSTNPGIAGHFYQAKIAMQIVSMQDEDFGNANEWIDVTDGCIPDIIREVKPDTDARNDLSPIKKCKYLIYHTQSMRFFAAGNPDDAAALYYSEIGKPNFFQNASKLYPTQGDGPVKGVKQVLNLVLVGYGHSWWGWEGIDPNAADTTWGNYPIPHGLVSNDTLQLTPEGFTFLSHDGIYTVSTAIFNRNIAMATDGTLIRKISSKKVDNTIANIKNPEYTFAVFYNSKYYLAYNDRDLSIQCNKMLCCYWDLGYVFVRYTDLKANFMLLSLYNRLLITGVNYIYALTEGFQNDIDEYGVTKAIRPCIKTKAFNFGNPLTEKIIYKFFVWSSQNVDSGNSIDIKLNIDFSSIDFKADLNSASFIWGSAWGAVWGRADIAPQYMPIMKRGIRVGVTITSDDINTRNSVVVYGIGFELVHKGLKARKIQV